MKRKALLLLIVLSGCTSEKPTKVGESLEPFAEIVEHRKKQHEHMLGKDSPLKDAERVNFLGLNYFAPDSSFDVKCKFQPIFNGQVFKMSTNTDRTPLYQKFALLTFKVNGIIDSLFAYKSAEEESTELFIPFTDSTNGYTTYSSGRFLDIEIPETDSINLDFNLAYNPYCAYNERYSCPIPPRENNLNLAIMAGEKKYKEDH